MKVAASTKDARSLTLQRLIAGRPKRLSFIAKSVFDRRAARHRDWRVIAEANARSKSAMIEVPQVEITGLETGPAWFTQRRDTDLHDVMSPMMDRRVEGARGGSALRYFRVTIDDPAAVANFEVPGR